MPVTTSWQGPVIGTTPRILGISGAAVPVTGTLVDTTLASIIVPANAMGANGALRVTYLFSATSSGNNKIYNIKWGGTVWQSFTVTTSAMLNGQAQWGNRNLTNSQAGKNLTNIFTTANASAITASVDTTAQTTITITGQLANTGETITLESYVVELLPG